MNEQVISFEQIVERGCGMDVHNETVVAIVSGNGIKAETRTFFTHTNDLYNCKDWLKELRVTHIAMESTGIYWKPVFNNLDEDFEILLVNARHIKNVPGHKTDKKDSKWIAKLLLSCKTKAGLLQLLFFMDKLLSSYSVLSRPNLSRTVLKFCNYFLYLPNCPVLGYPYEKYKLTLYL